jgi:hypothetical protein
MRLATLLVLLTSAAMLTLASTAVPAFAAAPAPLAAHQATYKLSLDSARGGEVTSVSGTMGYEVTDACDGWAVRQRLQMTLTNRDGQDIEMVSDYLTWESKDGLRMTFRTKQTTDTAVTEQVEGDAKLDATGEAGSIHYTVPEDKTAPLPAGTLFPMMHTAAIIAAAEGGKKFLALPLFDGTGVDGVQNTSVIVSNWNPPSASQYPVLAELPSGRVRVAFFDRKKESQSPDYEVGMKYWENGVADDLSMDFADFVVSGKLASFTVPKPHC